jgi:hypothetical protein
MNPARKTALIIYVPAFLSVVFLGNFVDEFKDAAIVGSIGIFLIIIYEMRSYLNETWFRISILIMIIVHGVFIYLVNDNLPPGPAVRYVVPAVFLDTFIMYGILVWLKSRFSTRN